MATYTTVEEEVIEKEREITECDYCRLVTTDDVEEDFHKAMLDPTGRIDVDEHWTVGYVTNRQGYVVKDDEVHYSQFIKDLAKADTPSEVWNRLAREMNFKFEEAADLCPGCAEDLFGDGPATGIRRGYEAKDEVDNG